jgi:radical SAM protein with 4Fe4S-binding SPASM domain
MDAKTYLTKKSFCVLPWTGVYIQPNGDVRNCAVTPMAIGNINNTPLEQILTGEVNTTVKTEMLNDIMRPQCGQCHRLESRQKNTFDQVSNRVWYLKKLKNTDKTVFDSPNNFKLKMLDLRWKNTCNFACVYCDAELSSRWATELKQPQRIESDALIKSLDYIYSNLDEVEHIYLAGGEPLLVRENLVLLEKMLVINPDVDLRLNTNLSVLDNDIYLLVKKFKNVRWTISIDNIGQEFEYLRYGGNWNKFIKNLGILTQDFGKESINFNSVWCALNSKSVFNCIDFLLTDMGFHENAIIVNPLEDPLWLDVNNLSDKWLEEIRNELITRIEQSNPQYCLNNSLTLMLNYISQPNFIKDISKTIDSLKTIDDRRNLNSKLIFPEVYQCLE